MKKLIKNVLFILCVVGTISYLHGNLGIATVEVAADDNGGGNGYYYMCSTTNKRVPNKHVWVDMSNVNQYDSFVYVKASKNNTAYKLFNIK